MSFRTPQYHRITIGASSSPSVCRKLADEACVGGTSARIVVVDGAETIVDLVIGQCGGSARAATDAVDQWIEPARALFPATDVLAPEGE
jgi:hypothetical protein